MSGPGVGGPGFAIWISEQGTAVEESDGERTFVPRSRRRPGSRRSGSPEPPRVLINTDLVTCYAGTDEEDGRVTYLTDGAVRIMLPIGTGGQIDQVRRAAYALLRATGILGADGPEAFGGGGL